MNTFSKIALVTVAVAGVTACDPYTAENKGPPAVLSVLGVVGNVADGAADGAASSVEATAPTALTGGPWVVGPVPSGYSVLMVKVNKLLDGGTIQAAADDCKPAGDWLSVNGVRITDGSWQTCYSPSSPYAAEGASIVIYPGVNPSGGPSGSGWFVSASFGTGVYRITGTVKDQQGHELPIDVEAFVADAPAVAMTSGTTPKAIETDTSIDVSWWLDAANVTSQAFQKLVVVDATTTPPTTEWQALATVPTTVPAVDPGAYHDASLKPGTEYQYRVVYTTTASGDFTSPVGAIWTLPTAPAKPTAAKTTDTSVSATPFVKITWTKSDGATSYNVERAPESTTAPGTPGTYATIASGKTVDATSGNGTYNDTSTTLTAGRNYFYRVVAVSDGSTTSESPDSDVVAF